MKPTKKTNKIAHFFQFWNNSEQRNLFLFWAFLVLISTVIIILLNILGDHVQNEDVASYKEGDIALSNFQAPFSYGFIDEDATEKKLKLAKISVHPVYVLNEDISRDVLDNFDLFSQMLLKSTGDEKDNLLVSKIITQYRSILNQDKVDFLVINGNNTALLTTGHELLKEILDSGYFGEIDPSVRSSNGILELISTDDENLLSHYLTTDKILDIKKVEAYLDSRLILFGLLEQEKKLVKSFVQYFLETNVFYSEDLTQMNQEKAESSVEPVMIHVFEGENILNAGTIVTQTQIQKIEALQQQTSKTNLKYFIFPLFFQMALLLFLNLSLNYLGIRIQGNKELYLFFSLMVLFLITAASIINFGVIPDGLPKGIFIPMALFGLSGALLFKDNRLALIIVICFSLDIFYLTAYDSVSFLVSLANGISGVLLIRGKNKRMELVKASTFLAGTHLIAFLFFQFFNNSYLSSLITGMFISVINGFLSGILTLAVLPIFEHFLNASTPFRLIELSDLNMPIMKRMLSLAPGTYVHSLNVANLAETACQNIDADALLARVGAYFHDIGKIDQAEYFIENQNQTDGNKHDDMKPSLSAAVIKSHVRIGLEKGRELNLPDEILDIIEQHHGTSTISYFYDKAVKEKGIKSVSIDDFSHSGPKPSSREAATVMLADAIEAATRTLKKPTAAKLEKFIWDIIMDRFRKGELNECSLTLKDLEVIKNTFVHVLTGHFHSRIEYPDQEIE